MVGEYASRVPNAASEALTWFRSSTVGQVVIGVLLWVRSSFLNFTIGLGVLLMVIGFIQWEGVVAAMLVVLGVSAILFGFLGYMSLKLIGYI